MAIKTAQDVLEETDIQPPGTKHSSREEEHDQVDEAYETISKKLENLRKGEKPDDDEEPNPSTGAQDRGEPVESEEPEDKKEDKVMEDTNPDEDPLNKDEEEDEKDPLDDVEEDEEPEESEEPNVQEEKKTFQKEDKPTSLNDLVEDEEKPVRETPPVEEISSGMEIPNLRPSAQNENFSQRVVSPLNEQRFDPGEEFGPRDRDKFFNRHNTSMPSNRSNKWHVLILILIGIGVIGATIYLLKGQFINNGSSAPSPSPVSETLPPSPSPSPEINRVAFKVRVLNGTTKSGLAASVSAKLKNLGYKQDKTANATNSAFLQTIVRSKTSSSSVSAQLIKDLSPDYDALDQTSLKDNDPADFEVILGAK